MPIIQKIFQQTSWQLLGKLSSSLSTLGVLAMVTRGFGESGTGLFTLGQTYLSFFVLAVDFGVNAYLLPQLKDPDFSIVWRQLLGLRLSLSIILAPVAILGIMLAYPGQKELMLAVLIGSVSIFQMAFYISCNALFQSRLRYDLSAISWSVGALIIVVLVYLITLIPVSIWQVFYGFAGGWIVSGLLAVLFVKKFIKNITPIIDFGFILKTLKHSWPLTLTLVVNVIYFRLDTFILSFYRSFAEVGIYNFGYQFFQTALVLPTFIMNAFYPQLIESYQTRLDLFKRHIRWGLLILAGLSILGIIVTLALAFPLVWLLSGGIIFNDSARVLQILALGFPGFFISSLLMWVLITIGQNKQMLMVYVFGLLLNIGLNLTAIPYYGYFGAAWTTVLTEYLIVLLQTFLLRKYLV